MLLVLVLVGIGGWVAYPRVAPIFLANPYLNGVIVLVFVVGLMSCLAQLYQLSAATRWIEGFANNVPTATRDTAPRLVGTLANLLGARKARMQLSAN